MGLTIYSCSTPSAGIAPIDVAFTVDGKDLIVELPPGSIVEDLLNLTGVSLDTLDRVEPPIYTILSHGVEVEVIRVREEFDIEQVDIPFEQQYQPSEVLLEGVLQPLQLGENGLVEITYRSVFENEIEVSRKPIRSTIVNEAVAQIMLIGVKASFEHQSFPGRLAYLSDGNAWVMDGSTTNRIPLVTTGDLDQRVFRLSMDHQWLLFSRSSQTEDSINSLWVINIDEPDQMIDLQAQNIIHFAGWDPRATSTIAYSTVEPRQAAPGWQANNDLITRTFSTNGLDSRWQVIQDTNSGGVYGWWGTDFVYSPDGESLAYSSPDEIGVIDLAESSRRTLVDLVPFQTHADWAWVPGLNWSEDGTVLYSVFHDYPEGSISPEESPFFNLIGIPMEYGKAVQIVSQVGMFAYPLPGREQSLPSGEKSYLVAYLQANFPDQSDTSRYAVMVMDRDGSNRRRIFPPENFTLLDPKETWGTWAPAKRSADDDGFLLVVIYQGNLWLVDMQNGKNFQLTADGLVSRADWK
jgi:hypothetical protein